MTMSLRKKQSENPPQENQPLSHRRKSIYLQNASYQKTKFRMLKTLKNRLAKIVLGLIVLSFQTRHQNGRYRVIRSARKNMELAARTLNMTRLPFKFRRFIGKT